MTKSICWGHEAEEEMRLASRQEPGLLRPLCTDTASVQVHIGVVSPRLVLP